MAKAFDARQSSLVAKNAKQITADGYVAVGMYYFTVSAVKQLLTADIVKACKAEGLSVWSVWENGYPTVASYFSHSQGNSDGHSAASRAQEAGQPNGTVIYFAADYDAAYADLTAITAYFAAVRAVLANVPGSYTAGIYGSGIVCQHLSELGLVSHTWLSQSTDFLGYKTWLPHASIVQGKTATYLGMDIDTDTTNGDGGGW